MKEAASAIYTNSKGKSITWEDLAGVTGRVDYESLGREGLTEEAIQYQREGQAAVRESDLDQAIHLFQKAHEIVPQWPYPTFSLAHAYLQKKDWQSALEYFEYTDKLAPQGFYQNKPFLHYLRKALEGKFPPGMILAYFRIPWKGNTEEQVDMAQQLSEQYPGFAPVWARLAQLQEHPKRRMASIEQGLAADPDPETKGNLLINKALVLHQTRKTPEAIRILGELLLQEDCTLATDAMARMALAFILH